MRVLCLIDKYVCVCVCFVFVYLSGETHGKDSKENLAPSLGVIHRSRTNEKREFEKKCSRVLVIY